MRFVEHGLSCSGSLCQPFLAHSQFTQSRVLHLQPWNGTWSCVWGSQEGRELGREWRLCVCGYRSLLPGITSVFGTWFIHEATESCDL